MKLIKSLTVFACAFALVATIAMAEDKDKDAKEKTQTCCEKATAKGKDCAHPCCVEAHKAGKSCEKCNKNKEDLKKKKGEKKETK